MGVCNAFIHHTIFSVTWMYFGLFLREFKTFEDTHWIYKSWVAAAPEFKM